MKKATGGAVRQRYAVATGDTAGIPQGTGTPRYKKGGSIDKTAFKKYGNGFRKSKGGAC